MQTCMAANWKMFKTHKEARQTAEDMLDGMKPSLPPDREVLLIPPFTALQAVKEVIQTTPGFSLGGQNFYPEKEGAFTGEISADMLLDQGCTYSLVGHSERRHIFWEDNSLIAKKVEFGLQRGLKIILCIGETLKQRKNGQLEKIIEEQLKTALKPISNAQTAASLDIAYEPVWAIGTGEVAQSKDIEQAHNLVKNILQEMFSNESNQIRLLYGGSVKPENISEILGLDNVHGVLVGGASLKAESFSKIVLSP